MSYILADIAKKIGAAVIGDEQCEISSIATLTSATSGQIAFLANSKYSAQLATTQASAVIITKAQTNLCQTNALVMDNPYMGYALVAQLLDTTPNPANSIHPSAVIADGVTLGKGVTIGANAVIETGVNLADGVSIGAGSFIGIAAQIGAHSSLWSNVSIYHGVVIGEQCLVHANTVIGADGFGYANNKGSWVKIPQLGTVIIGDNVEIGASTTIDRGALGNTIIKNGVILDNQIQIAHNVVIGENTAIAACSVIAGSTEIGKNCVIAGLVGINGHINITDGCVFTGMTMVTKAISESGVYSSGMPCQPNKEWHKNNARIKKLESLTKRLMTVEKDIDALKS
ncbi:UDP-3-O-(3-hydroxymyristoyl)glucosamine N-acyltransferase [Colwellia sp. M166]|uniref:UDP-3-O-(3-hydroxymyristoyl)glucosamine N-acyltransferase n=1 Tax=Colwellia sp. M166 TaxID=2583805 RepID=UPI00211EFB45|nr:UDP-3-O-(3-hydroxymyristoyl)glucosamine N-acyltransferase [Colwellia sp. M166]UUO21866.1 UDP-3-O-(3-hydroxymyristoyl)glucosamine N-acyltransferase [Colwellia sp. M166]|tara:strand:- start:21801 stop:22826 length:1026 start_codon:yes stop_codon:yes gene_type:complete